MSDERNGILAAIRDAHGNISRAAEKLGVARRTLQNRMRHFAIPEGKPGRRKMKISYRRRQLYRVGAVAVGALVAVAVVKGRKSSA
jgi:hypothetical protein